jgi:hypothetical protein
MTKTPCGCSNVKPEEWRGLFSLRPRLGVGDRAPAPHHGEGGGQSLNISCLANPPPATRRFFSVMTSFADHRETDLFGQPVRPNKGRRGRPALQVTNEGRDMLEMACARGWPNARIAEAVGISVPSLKRHFRSRPVQPPRPRRWRGKLAPRSELRRPVPGSGAGAWPADPVRCNRPVRGAGAGSWHPDPSFADLSRGLARAAGRPIPSGATAPFEVSRWRSAVWAPSPVAVASCQHRPRGNAVLSSVVYWLAAVSSALNRASSASAAK